MSRRNVALIGCGAISQSFYLPAIAKHRARFDDIWLVDPSDAALTNAASIVPGRRAQRLTDVDDNIQLAIVATPNNLHFPIACEALFRGADVLVEKPFAIWPDEGRRLVETAAANGRVVAVNQTRRFFPLCGALRRQLDSGDLGDLTSIVHREGTKLVWPFESGAAFAPGARRTGVIMDFGVHVVDFYHYLLNPKWQFVSAIHDGFNGPESLAEMELRVVDVSVSIRLSRYHQQENIARLTFERGEVSFGVYDNSTYFIRSTSGQLTTVETGPASSDHSSQAEAVLLNFLGASERTTSALCDAASSLPVIEILDEVYRKAQLYPSELGDV